MKVVSGRHNWEGRGNPSSLSLFWIEHACYVHLIHHLACLSPLRYRFRKVGDRAELSDVRYSVLLLWVGLLFLLHNNLHLGWLLFNLRGFDLRFRLFHLILLQCPILFPGPRSRFIQRSISSDAYPRTFLFWVPLVLSATT